MEICYIIAFLLAYLVLNVGLGPWLYRRGLATDRDDLRQAIANSEGTMPYETFRRQLGAED